MTVIDPLPFALDAEVLAQKLRIKAGSPSVEDLTRLIAEAQQVARPRAVHRLCFIADKTEDSVCVDGVTLTSRVLRVNLGDLQRFFAYVVTSGAECEAWANAQPDFLARFYADAINQAVLRSAVQSFLGQMSAAYSLGQVSVMNPGSLTDWPISQQQPLFALLGDVHEAIGVRLLPSFLMAPTKSVSGILFPTEETFASCQLCPREDCPNRRAPYDAGLFDRKYRAAAETTPPGATIDEMLDHE